MRKTIEVGGKQGDMEEKSIAFRYDIEVDNNMLVDVLGCDIVFCNDAGETIICPVGGRYEDLWDQLSSEEQDEAIREEEDPLDREVQYREQRRIFERKFRMVIK